MRNVRDIKIETILAAHDARQAGNIVITIQGVPIEVATRTACDLGQADVYYNIIRTAPDGTVFAVEPRLPHDIVGIGQVVDTA